MGIKANMYMQYNMYNLYIHYDRVNPDKSYNR